MLHSLFIMIQFNTNLVAEVLCTVRVNEAFFEYLVFKHALAGT